MDKFYFSWLSQLQGFSLMGLRVKAPEGISALLN